MGSPKKTVDMTDKIQNNKTERAGMEGRRWKGGKEERDGAESTQSGARGNGLSHFSSAALCGLALQKGPALVS